MTEDHRSSPSAGAVECAGRRQAVSTNPRLSAIPRLAGILLILAFAILYLVTLDNGLRPGELEGGDLITHQYAQVQGRPGNAPGYPLYTMGGWLWFHLWRAILGPDSNPIPILSSYSTLWALAALWLLYRLILEITDRGEGGNWPVGVLVTAFYGATYFFWYYAVTSEQYTSAIAWTLAVIFLAFRWEHARFDRYLLAIAFLVGIGLAHMVTVLFLVPPLLWFLLGAEPRLLRRPNLIAAAIGVAVLPLLSYAFVYLRGAAHPEWQGAGRWSTTWQWFWSFLSTGQGRGELTWSLTPVATAEFPALIWQEMTWLGLLLGLLGLTTLARRRAIFLNATVAFYLVFSWVDRLGNWYQVIMPVYAILALGIAAAADRLWRSGRRRAEELGSREAGEQGSGSVTLSATRLGNAIWQDDEVPFRQSERSGRPGRNGSVRVAPMLVVVVLAALVLYRAVKSYPLADSSGRPGDTGLAPGWAILAEQPPGGIRILATTPEALALDYLADIWGTGSDVRAVTSARARELLAAGSSKLAVTEQALPLAVKEVGQDLHYSALTGRLVEIKSRPGGSLSPLGPVWREQAWAHEFGGLLRLTGGRARRDVTTGETTVLLAWQAPAGLTEDWSVSVRLTEGERELVQLDRANPVAGAYPTSRWSPGEVVGDAYTFAPPVGTTPDGVTIILYRRMPDGAFTNLDVARLPLQFEAEE